MSHDIKTFSAAVTPQIAEFLQKNFHPEDPVLSEIRSRSAARGLPQIHIGIMDGLHLEVLTRMVGARKAVEIGTLAGYSGVCILRGMGEGGTLYTFDADRKHLSVAHDSFQKAGFSDRVKAFVGPATENLPKIDSDGPFDLVFIDADKTGYPQYLNWAAENLRLGGVVIADNTLGWGMIADEKFENPEDEAAIMGLKRFNQEAAQSGRFRATLLPTGEGLTVAVKIR